MIEVHNVRRSFGSRTVLNRISFRIAAGEPVLLAGLNGAGKTTLLRILSGYAPADSGTVRIAGTDLFDDPMTARARIGYMPENAPLYADQRVTEYLRFRGRLRRFHGRGLRRRTEAVLEQCELTALRREWIGRLSRGQRTRVALADALLHEPEVLLLDDPLAALDLTQRRHFLELLCALRGASTLLISTHTPDDVEPLVSRMLLLRDGMLHGDVPVASDTPGAPPLRERMTALLAVEPRPTHDSPPAKTATACESS